MKESVRMKRTILAGLAIALGATCLMAQVNHKSRVKPKPYNAMINAAQSRRQRCHHQGRGRPALKVCRHVFKVAALNMEASAYHRKGDDDHAQVYAEQALQADPKDYQAPLLDRRNHRAAHARERSR